MVAAQIGSPLVEEYEYDGFNQLKSVLIDGVKTEYTYKPDGLRISKTTGNDTICHIWDGSNISVDMKNGAVDSKYIRGVNLLSYIDNTGVKKLYWFNGHGDVVSLTNVSGNLLWSYEYDAFGVEKPIAGQNPENDNNPFRYCGEYFDAETGSIYLRARYYNPKIGRFITQDPINDGLNWYTYCGNSPVMFVDPSGLWIEIHGDTNEERQEILKYLQMLTDYYLGYEEIVTGKGENRKVHLRIKRSVTFKHKGDEKLPAGNALIMFLADNEDHKVEIKYGSKNKATMDQAANARNGIGAGSYVYINTKKKTSGILVYDEEKGKAVKTKSPTHISLAHELIHAYRMMKGVYADKTLDHEYLKGKVDYDVEYEELYTIGIWAYEITENMIRAEQQALDDIYQVEYAERIRVR